MPLPENEATVATAKELVTTFKKIFGNHAGFRPAHARGLMLSGTFTPTPEAAKLSAAPHFNAPSTPIVVRFSSSTGIPEIPDTDPNANPRGFAVRFNLPAGADGRRRHTDIVSHSTPHFPVRTGEEFLAFLHAIMGGTVPDFLAAHPAAATFVQAPKPFPESLATEGYYGLNAFKFVDGQGKGRYVRYRFVPEAGEKFLDDGQVGGRGPGYLWDELRDRVATGPVEFGLWAQIAEEGDTVDDVTATWPEIRELVKLGGLKIEKVLEDSLAVQKTTIFDPVPRGIEGLEPSTDPLIDMRAAIYLISGRERRSA